MSTQRDKDLLWEFILTVEESFLLTFDSIIEDTVIYTNIQGRRIVREIGLEWHNMDRIEMEAFIGLHLLSGTYNCMYTFVFVLLEKHYTKI